jgi:hypothetical protein
MQMNMLVAIDFTASNGTLHPLQSDAYGVME